jgi:hypothetical protein
VTRFELVNLNSRALLVFVIPVALAAGAPQLFAQAAGPQRGLNGLFGGGRSEPKTRQKLNFTLSSAGAYDSALPDEVRTLGVSGTGGRSAIFGGAADYSWESPRVQVRASGTSSLQYFRPLADVFYSLSTNASHTAGVGISARLTTRTGVLVNQTVRYSPSSLSGLFPRTAVAVAEDAPLSAPEFDPPAAPDYAISGSESRSYGTAMTLTHDFSPRNSVSATADYQYSDTQIGTAGGRDLSVYGVRGRVTHRLTGNTTTTAEYLSRVGDVGYGSATTTDGPLTEHSGEFGADYSRPLSETRQMTLGARLGATTMRLPESAAEGGMGGRHYARWSGQVAMGYAFGRTWQARAIYRRGIDYVAGLTEPVSADSFSANVDGLLTRRVDVRASAGYSSGKSALNPDASTFDTYTGDVRLRYALTRLFAAHVEYVYYLYDSRGSTALVPGIPAGFERNGARVGFTLILPPVRR